MGLGTSTLSRGAGPSTARRVPVVAHDETIVINDQQSNLFLSV